MLEWLKRFDPDGTALDELVALDAFAQSLRTQYAHWTVEEPEWLGDKIRVLKREITGRRRDALELRLKEIARQKTKLMTTDEKRTALAAEEDRLLEQLREQPAQTR